jgi:alkylhydroperoxidase family enzyme
MIGRVVERQLRAAERRFGASMDYMRHVAEREMGLFLKISLLQPATWHRRALPADAFHAARLAATSHADCGECVQVEVSAARQAGVPPEILRAVLEGRTEELPEGVAAAVAFARTVAAGQDPDNEVRGRLAGLYGEEGVIELAAAVATAQFYPTLKRGLGFAKSCSRVRIEV